MATQYGINNAVTMVVQPHHHQQFVSSSVYYGYVPMRLQDEADHQAGGMDVDADRRAADLQNQQQQQHQHHLLAKVESPRCLVQRKRAIGHEELAACVPRLKRFREGDRLWAEEGGLAQVYHESPLLRLSPAADFDMACEPALATATTTMTGNLKFQSASLSRNAGVRCQELEDMLLLTHGCSSYHHYRQIQLNQSSDSEEAEF